MKLDRELIVVLPEGGRLSNTNSEFFFLEKDSEPMSVGWANGGLITDLEVFPVNSQEAVPDILYWAFPAKNYPKLRNWIDRFGNLTDEQVQGMTEEELNNFWGEFTNLTKGARVVGYTLPEDGSIDFKFE